VLKVKNIHDVMQILGGRSSVLCRKHQSPIICWMLASQVQVLCFCFCMLVIAVILDIGTSAVAW